MVVIENNAVRIKPVKSVGGSLAGYARKYCPNNEARQKVWKEVAGDKAKN